MKCKYIFGSETAFEAQLDAWLKSNPNINIIKADPLNSPNNLVSVLFTYRDQAVVNTKIPEMPSNEIPKCPTCGGDMRIAASHATGNLFFGCKKFPACKGMRSFEQRHWEILGGDPGKSAENEIPF